MKSSVSRTSPRVATPSSTRSGAAPSTMRTVPLERTLARSMRPPGAESRPGSSSERAPESTRSPPISESEWRSAPTIWLPWSTMGATGAAKPKLLGGSTVRMSPPAARVSKRPEVPSLTSCAVEMTVSPETFRLACSPNTIPSGLMRKRFAPGISERIAPSIEDAPPVMRVIRLSIDEPPW